MPSKQSEAVKRRWEASRLAMVQPGFEGPDDESWGDLTAEPRGVDYLETEAGGLPAMWAGPKGASTDRGRTYASTSSRACCTRSRWPPGGHRRPTARSASWPAGYGPG